MRKCLGVIAVLALAHLPSMDAPVSAQTAGWPTPATTGVPAGTTLKSCGSSITVTTDGTVIDKCLYTGNVVIDARNVTISNSEIRGVVKMTSGSFTITDSTVGPPTGCQSNSTSSAGAVGHHDYVARRVHIRNTNEGFRAAGASNVRIEDSYVHLCSVSGDHTDGFQAYQSQQNIVLNHNTIDLRNASNVTAAIFFADYSDSGTATNNLLMGGGYTLRVHDDNSPDIGPWVITGNRIVDGSWRVGPTYNANLECSGSKTTWSDNRLVKIDSNYNILSVGGLVNCSGSVTNTTTSPPAAPTQVRIIR